MARIKTSGIISDIRGKIGGSVFQRGNGGLILRSGTTPVNKKSNRTEFSKSVQSSVRASWLALTSDQRQVWASFMQYKTVSQLNNAELFLSGQQYYMKCQYYRLYVGFSALTVPGFKQPTNLPRTFTIDMSGGQLIVTDPNGATPTSMFQFIFLTGTVPPSVNNPSNRLRAIPVQFFNAVTYDISTEYISIFGALPSSGDELFIKQASIDVPTGFNYPFITTKITIS